MRGHIAHAVLASLLALTAVPARATCEHEYAAGEYAVIRDGLSPDKRVSLAANGEEEFGDGYFHVWLMEEPTHRKIIPLDNISSNNNLDTCPDSYHAFWSADSRHAAVGFRFDRLAVRLNLYSIEKRHAHPISGPSLFQEVTSREVDDDDHLRQSFPSNEWRGGRRFRLREYRTFVTWNAALAPLLGKYGRVIKKFDDAKQMDGNLEVEFSAEADCLLLPGHRYRVVDLRPGKSGGGFDSP